MNGEIDRYLTRARLHELALAHARELRREAIVHFWARIDQALAQAACGARRSSRWLWHGLKRRAGVRPTGCASRA